MINEVRAQVSLWRSWPNSNEWQIIPETARLLKQWRQHKFSGVRPFFCQIEAVETAIWLTEVAPSERLVNGSWTILPLPIHTESLSLCGEKT